MRAPLEVVERRLVGSDHPRAGTGFDRHVADRHPGFHGQRLDGAPAVLEDVALAAARADLGDHGQDDVLGGDPDGQLAVDVHREGAEGVERQRLRGQHVLDLARADPERQGAERAVRGGVAVAADHGHARLGQPELRADDVHDALVDVAHRVEPHAELLAVAAQRLDLGPADEVGDRARRSSGRCGPRSRGSGRAGGPSGPPAAARRTPAGWSPRAGDGGRCRAGRARPRPGAPRARPRPSRPACLPCPVLPSPRRGVLRSSCREVRALSAPANLRLRQ